ncbi:MAG: hypothetical protein PUF72_06560 [Clostridiales bacterium]|nr:hypothetical protein [Clostridiales bacterium]
MTPVDLQTGGVVKFAAQNYASLINIGGDTPKIAIYKSEFSSIYTEYKLDPSAVMKVNGVEAALSDYNCRSYLDGNTHEIAYLSDTDLDGDYDCIEVRYLATATVDFIDETDWGYVKIGFNTYDIGLGKAYLIIDDQLCKVIKNGQEIGLSDIKPGDALSIEWNAYGEVNSSDFYTIYVTDNTVTGTCTMTGKDTDGREYFVLDNGVEYYMSGATRGDSLLVGDEYTLNLDYYGDIASYERFMNFDRIAVIDKFYTSAGDTMVRLITSDDKKVGYKLKEDKSDLLLSGTMEINRSYTDAMFPIEERIVYFSVNSDGECTIKGLVSDVTPGARVKRVTGIYDSVTKKIGDLKLSDESVVLYAENYAVNTSENVYKKSIDYFENNIKYEVVAVGTENINNSSYPFIVIISGGSGYNVNTQMAIFESSGSTIVDGEIKDVMYVYINGRNSDDYKGRTKMICEYGVVKYAYMSEGDAIIYKTDSDGYVDDIKKLTKMSIYDIAGLNGSARNALAYASTPTTFKYSSSEMIADDVKLVVFKGYGEVSFVFGPVIYKTEDEIKIASVSRDSSNEYVSDVEGRIYSYGSDTKFYSYNGNGRTGYLINNTNASGVLQSVISNTGYVDANKSIINWNNENTVIRYALLRLVNDEVKEVYSIEMYDKAGTTTADVAVTVPEPEPYVS